MKKSKIIEKNGYRGHYLKINKTYPSVFALKIFLGNNPDFRLKEKYPNISKIIDIGFGDGRDIGFFLEQGYHVSGVEPDSKVVNHTIKKFKIYQDRTDLRVGTNMDTGFNSEVFDAVYSSGAVYYLPSLEHSIIDAFKESYRILRKGGLFMGTLARNDSHTLSGAKKINENTFILKDSFYNYRNGQVYHVYSNKSEIEKDFKKVGFNNIMIYNYDVNWFGTRERLFIFVTTK
jgi:tellurite methyltransferase